jgi:protein-S-isoprenylcysteine O-methyltransferase Ste14
LTVLRVSVTVGVVLAVLAQRVSASAFVYNAVIFVISLTLLWAGIGLRLWCFRTLGRYFTFAVMTSGDQPVIDTGPYALLRHPSYAGILLALFGLGLSFGNWLSVVALLVCALLGFINRIHVEERALSAALGPAYTSYAGTRKRIIPFVW